jgi:Protein of unknown function (DUF2569)
MSDLRDEGLLPAGNTIHEPVSIGGWLILPIVHLVLNASVILYQLISEFWKGYSGGTSTSEAAPQPIHLTLGLKCSIAFALYLLIIVFYAIFCFVRFLQKKRNVPKLMIAFYVMLLVMAGATYFLLVQFPELVESPGDVGDAIMGIIRTVIADAVWIPYFVVSVRVKDTFVR